MSRKTDVRLVAAGAVALLLAGCAGNQVPPPTDQLSDAASAVERAEQAGAIELAAFEITKAKRKLENAKDLARDEDDEDRTRASRLARQAEVDARLAEAQARLAQTRQIYDEVEQTVDVLRRTMDTGPSEGMR